ncbi:uncharacterized protein [Mytilus edulis]|uniref:uncharacterized protein n=1 Tax=Mytilus edulis TaxID=6550 RepID=UPI0039EF789E
MSYRTDNNHSQSMIYFSFFFFAVSAAVTEFPCTFPSPWSNQSFSISTFGTHLDYWQFNTDCQTYTTNVGMTWLCHQITERFLVVRLQGSEDFSCYPIFYNLQGAPLMFTFGIGDEAKTFANQTGEFTDICEVCKMPTVYAVAKVPGSPDLPSPNQSCDIPSMCPSPGKACSAYDVIPKGSGCPIPTPTTTEQTTTTPELTTSVPISTSETKTTTRVYRSHCRKRNHRHP